MSSKLGVENIAHTNGTNAMTISSGGVATFPNPPVNVGVSNLQYFAVDGNMSLTTSEATITSYRDGHDTENFKRIGTAWTESNGVFTPTVSGMYEINFIASISAKVDSTSPGCMSINDIFAFLPTDCSISSIKSNNLIGLGLMNNLMDNGSNLTV